MNETKPAYQSVGIMGPLIGLVVFICNRAWPGLGITDTDVAPMVDAGSAIFTGLTALYGRYAATKQVSLTGK